MKIRDADVRAEAASRLDKNIVVTAGAGTGKTSLLVERVLHHVLERGTPLPRLASITFTEKAASEMRERLEEALEATVWLTLDDQDLEALDGGGEAERVVRRLLASRGDRFDRAAVHRRALDALAALDDASISTIHSFCAELLRRHAALANLDPEFEIDASEEEQDRCFDEVWGAYLEESLSESGATDADSPWHLVLERLSIETIERLARQVARFSFPLEDLQAESPARQEEALRRLAVRHRASVEDLSVRLSAVDGLNPNVLKQLRLLESALDRMVETGRFAAQSDLDEELASSCSMGKGADLGERERNEYEARLKRLLAFVRLGMKYRLDPHVPRLLGAVLAPFAVRFRGELLKRGFVSHDALIVLARDVLRDDPTVRQQEGRRFDHLLIDEFQDTDPLQYEIAFFLAESVEGFALSTQNDAYEVELAPGKLFIVGDAKQSIYRFRGADIVAFQRALQTVERNAGLRYELITNFRSVPEVVEPLNRLFDAVFSPSSAIDPEYAALDSALPSRKERRIELWTPAGEPGRVEERRQVEAERIADRLAEEAAEKGLRFGQVAMLFRRLTTVDRYVRALAARGIPFVMEGGKGFYTRYEVSLLLSLLRAVTTGSSPVPLIAWLRSPAAAVPDVELERFARSQRARRAPGGKARAWASSCWRLDATVDRRRCPELHRALGQLREFAARHRDAPLEEIARAALEETPLLVSMAASFNGARSVGNLEKIVRRIGELAADGRRSSEEILDVIEQKDANLRDQGDSPLADETVDAVQILSIHKSKGLEWPVVILPDLVEENKGGRRGDTVQLEVFTPDDETERARALAFSGSGVRSPAWFACEAQREEHEAAEARRLLYVATTRAAERLILLTAPARKGEGDAEIWGGSLRAWGAPEASGVLRRELAATRSAAGARGAVALDPVVVDAVSQWKATREDLASREWPCLRSPAAGVDEVVRAEAVGTGEDRAVAAVARAIGSALHLLLEVWDGGDVAMLFDRLEAAVDVVLSRERAARDACVAGVRARLEIARDRGELEKLGQALRQGRVRGREMPAFYRDSSGDIWDGFIDWVSEREGGPEVVDFKTHVGRSSDDLARVYRPQLEHYAEALRRALELDDLPAATVLGLPPENDPD